MTDLQNDESGSQQLPATGKESADIHEDEINLADYFIVLWKHKYLISLGSLVPALVVGLALYSSPKSYKVTYVYDKSKNTSDWDFTQLTYKVLLDQFYSVENTNRIRAKLPEYNPQMVRFEPWPLFVTLSEADKKTLTQSGIFNQIKAQLLYVLVVGRDRNDILESASVMRDNFEHVLPLYSIIHEITDTTRVFRTNMGDMERGKFDQELDLNTNKAILTRLKNVKTETPDKTGDYPGWQIDVGDNVEYLPLEYQIQAAQLQIAKLEEKIKADDQRYEYYKNLASINERLSKELKDNISANHDYTIQQFHSYMTESIAGYETEELKDYLASYIKRIENRISASVPVTENPKISSIAKGTAKKSAIVFVVALMMSVFAAFLLEDLKKSQAQAS